MEQPATLVGLSGSKTGMVRFENAPVDRRWLLGEPIENVMQAGVGASTGGLQTSTLALGLSQCGDRLRAPGGAARPELSGAADQLQAELDENLASLRALAAGDNDSACTAADLRSQIQQPGASRHTSGAGGRQRRWLRARTSGRAVVPRSAVFSRMELPAARVSRQPMRTGENRVTNLDVQLCNSWKSTHRESA